jgi:hypothetical protein
MSFRDWSRGESLAEHLLRNAIALGLSVDQRRRLTYAYRLGRGTRWDKAEARAIASKVQAELDADLVAVVRAAEERGEVVGRFNDAGARIVLGRDGLAQLVRAGSLTEPEARAGLAYRKAYEQPTAALRSALGHAGEGRGGDLGDAPALHRAYLLARLAQMERAVLARQQNGLELAVLRLVAGDGLSLGSVASRGKSRDLHLAAFRRAIASVAAALNTPLANRCEVEARN